MTREESKKMIYDASKQDTGSPKDCIHLLSLHRFIEQIFDEHEAQLKAKNEEIARLYTENKKLMEHITLKNLSKPIVLCVKCSSEVMLKDSTCGS